MNRLELVTKTVLLKLEDTCYGYKKVTGYRHLFGVSTLCMQIAKKRNLDIELAGCMGMLHDFATYYTNTSFDHANRSAMLAKTLLAELHVFEDREIEVIYQAIYHHSDKENTHDDYSEVLKDGDVLCQYLEEPDNQYPQERIKRLEILKKQGII